jgi:hypothetical protein
MLGNVRRVGAEEDAGDALAGDMSQLDEQLHCGLGPNYRLREGVSSRIEC